MSSKGSWNDTEEAPAANPFAALGRLRDALPVGPAAPAPASPGAPPVARAPARAVIRLERKGRNGKDVTIISELRLDQDNLKLWLKELKTELGSGGALEDDTIVLQGDLRTRLPPLLEARGVRKVIRG